MELPEPYKEELATLMLEYPDVVQYIEDTSPTGRLDMIDTHVFFAYFSLEKELRDLITAWYHKVPDHKSHKSSVTPQARLLILYMLNKY